MVSMGKCVLNKPLHFNRENQPTNTESMSCCTITAINCRNVAHIPTFHITHNTAYAPQRNQHSRSPRPQSILFNSLKEEGKDECMKSNHVENVWVCSILPLYLYCGHILPCMDLMLILAFVAYHFWQASRNPSDKVQVLRCRYRIALC